MIVKIKRVTRVIDGDTFKAEFFKYFPAKIRVSSIDTPEIRGDCHYERSMANDAMQFTQDWLRDNSCSLRIKMNGFDRYGRVLANVLSDNGSLGDALINAGLAKKWQGRRYRNWCNDGAAK